LEHTDAALIRASRLSPDEGRPWEPLCRVAVLLHHASEKIDRAADAGEKVADRELLCCTVQVIRTATAADLPALQRIYEAASLSNAGDAPLLLATPEYLVFEGAGIAEGRTRVADEGPAAGFVTTVEGPDGLELEDLFVDPPWHRKGIARQLVEDVAATARQAGRRELWVVGNPHALGFYQAAGFVEVGRIPTVLGSGLRLRLTL
jgi:GNAT superfamily N-acetyltransferase